MLGFPSHPLHQSLSQVARRQQEVVEASRARVAGEQVEQLRQVLAEGLPAREEPEVLVHAPRPGIVVAGGEMTVAPDTVGLLPNHEAGLAVRLEAGEAVDDVRAHFLKSARPPDIRLLVEARLQLHEDRDLLAVLHGGAQRVSDGRGRAHPVERHLDREHLGVRGSLPHEARDGVEGMVRVVHQDVPRADGAPDVRRALERGHGMRRLRPVLEPRHVHRRVELEEVREGREALALVEVLRGQLQLVQQGRQDVGRQVAVVLQAHGGAEAALPQALFDAGEQVVGAARGLQDRVARDPNRMARQDVVTVVDAGQVHPHHVFEQHEHIPAGRIGHSDEAGQHLARDVDDGQRAVRQRGRRRRPDGRHEAQRTVAEVREGMARIDGQRRQHGQERPAEVVPEEALLLLACLLGAEEHDAFRGEQRLDLLEEAAVLLLHQLVHAVGDGGQRLADREPVRPRRLIAGPDAPLQRRHADHEGLVQVRAEDGEELHPLKQGHARVLRLLEYAPVELEPRQLTIDERVRVHVSLDR